MILDAHREAVFRFLVAAVGRDEADDCFQETFLSALRAYPKLKDTSNLRGWIFTIAHRKAMDSHRSRNRRPRPSAQLPDGRVEPPAAEPEIWEAVRGLPPKQGRAVLLRFLGDLGYRDIGEIMGSSEDAVRRNVHDGLKRLREEWSK